jgi:23S rRNA (guanosine2251-2'-O)-methyltransferase
MVIYGYHAIEEILKKGGIRGVLSVGRDNPRSRQLSDLASRAGVPVEQVSNKELDRMCGNDRHRGAALTVEKLPAMEKRGDLRRQLEGLQAEDSLILILDGITDPHNFGAILRSCDQFAVDLVIAPERRSAQDSETVLRTSAGASRHMPVCTVPNLVQAIKLCKQFGFWIYGAHLEGRQPDEVALSGKIVIILGSEGKGPRRLVLENCDEQISIPSGGRIDSLNVSVAAGILLYEVRRQQGFHFRK